MSRDLDQTTDFFNVGHGSLNEGKDSEMIKTKIVSFIQDQEAQTGRYFISKLAILKEMDQDVSFVEPLIDQLVVDGVLETRDRGLTYRYITS